MKRLLRLLVPVLLPGICAQAGELRVEITPESNVAWVGVVCRFNSDGTLARPVNPKAKFESPYCDAKIRGGRGTLKNLKPGIYDAIVFLKTGERIEGYHWPIFNEFEDPDVPDFQSPPPDDVAETIRKIIAGTRYYENKVTPLDMAGNEEKVRVLMQLLRDRKTSYDRTYGAPVATLRYEIWQFTNYYGGWTRDKSSRVLHRILEARDSLRKRTWVWDRKLGGIKVGRSGAAASLQYRIPSDLKTLPGLHPY